MFIDHAVIEVKAGAGGSGSDAFRREKGVPRGGPAGGDGGKGGDVLLEADAQLTTLLDYSYRRHYKADRGKHGGGKNRTGRSGDNLILKVPKGTIAFDAESGESLGELLEDGEHLMIAAGGRGGRGNTRFKTPTRQAPRRWESGGDGEERRIRLELKLIADVGLVGEPNAGKSTFLAMVTDATPKVADYPFTTLEPNLGVVRLRNFQSFVIADIPGIIEGAHDGRGLGDRFLRHIERTASLLLLLDVSGFAENPPEEEYKTLIKELELFSPGMLQKARAVAFTKLDTVTEPESLDKLQQQLESAGETVFKVSSVSGEGIQELLHFLAEVVKNDRQRETQIFGDIISDTDVPNSIWDD